MQTGKRVRRLQKLRWTEQKDRHITYLEWMKCQPNILLNSRRKQNDDGFVKDGNICFFTHMSV